jgi:hypothetical protein
VRPRKHKPHAPLLEAADGFALGALLATAICLFDLHGLGTMIAQDRAPLVPLLLLIAGLGGTFAVAAFGTGLCLGAQNETAGQGARRRRTP